MPTYEYACQKCNHHFERYQSITAPALKRCPKCGGRVQRVIHGGAALVFKGSGFYCTDNRRGSGNRSQEKAPCGRDGPCSSESCRVKDSSPAD